MYIIGASPFNNHDRQVCLYFLRDGRVLRNLFSDHTNRIVAFPTTLGTLLSDTFEIYRMVRVISGKKNRALRYV